MPLSPGSSQGIVSGNIREMVRAGHPRRVAVAAALSNADRHPGRGIVRRDEGGAIGSLGDYDTPLSRSKEANFQAWLSAQGRGADLQDYDMRGWWDANGQPGPKAAAHEGHFTDEFKKPTHPTFSDESKYHGANGNQGGHWGGTDDTPTFTPGPTNLQNMTIQQLQDYFSKVEPGIMLNLPQPLAAGGIVPRYDYGGMVDPDAGLTPSVATQTPQAQAEVQRFAAMSPEQLQEMVVRLGATPQGQLAQQILQRKRTMPGAQAVPGAPTAPMGPQAGIIGRAAGGSMDSPWWEKAEARGLTGSGFLSGSTPGRSDMVRTAAPPGAYIVPADVIAGLGDGNSMAGARVVDAMLQTGPWGTPLPRIARGSGPPRAPHAKGGPVKHLAKQPVPVALSDGEYHIAPADVARIGNGDVTRGHDVLDKWVLLERKKHIKTLKKLPGPVK